MLVVGHVDDDDNFVDILLNECVGDDEPVLAGLKWLLWLMMVLKLKLMTVVEYFVLDIVAAAAVLVMWAGKVVGTFSFSLFPFFSWFFFYFVIFPNSFVKHI